MQKTYEERLHDVNEKIAVQYQQIKKAKDTIKELKVTRTKLEKKIEHQKIEELTSYLKKQGITSIEELEEYITNDNSEKNEE